MKKIKHKEEEAEGVGAVMQLQLGDLIVVIPLLEDSEVVMAYLETLIQTIKDKILRDKDYKAYMKFWNQKKLLKSQGYAG